MVVDDDKAFRVATKTLLEDEGYRGTTATNGEEGLEQMHKEEIDLLVSDLVMGRMGGIALLAQF